MEVKLSRNGEINRSVFGQVIEYAANLSSVPIENIRCALQENNESLPDNLDTFISRLDGNIKGGRMRLIIAADELPEGAKVILRFLNKGLPGIDFCGVEVTKIAFGSAELITASYVETETKKPSASKLNLKQPQWTMEDIYRGLDTQGKTDDIAFLKELEEKAASFGLEIRIGKGQKEIGMFFQRAGSTLFTAYFETEAGRVNSIYLEKSRLPEGAMGPEIRNLLTKEINQNTQKYYVIPWSCFAAHGVPLEEFLKTV